jgi:hypothetical protein
MANVTIDDDRAHSVVILFLRLKGLLPQASLQVLLHKGATAVQSFQLETCLIIGGVDHS